MKITLSWLLLFSLPGILPAQESNKLTIGIAETFQSKFLNEHRTVWIYNPSSGHANQPNHERYPALYLLDAEQHFHSTVGMIRQMNGRWPNMIVVGIVNTNRDRDLKPSIDRDANPFMNYIEKELIPFIESRYPTAPYRVFSGHSLGGLTVVHTLLQKTTLFNAYIAIDPSLWWNDELLVRQAKTYWQGKQFANRTLFIGRANNMPPKMDTVTAMKDNTQYTMLFRAVSTFVNDLRKSNNKDLRWTSQFYPEESHGTVQLNGQYDALKFLFNYYQFRTSQFEFHPELDMDSVVHAHFKNVSQRLGYTVLPSQGLVNNLGYTCMGLQKWSKAEMFFKLNIENYPEEANCYDSMGDYYHAVGNLPMAIENYAKALTLGNDSDTRRKLEELKNQQEKTAK